MPQAVDITVHCIAKSKVDREQMRAWLDSVGAVEYPWDGPLPRIPAPAGLPQEVVDQAASDLDSVTQWEGNNVTDATVLVGNAAKRCYKSFEPGLNPNVTKVRQDWAEYFANVLKVGHGSVLEHASWTFAIEGLTRVCTAELNRHRAGVAISEGSMRYIRFTPDEIPYWEPLSIQEAEGDSPELSQKKAESRAIFNATFAFCARRYSELLAIWEDELAPDSRFAGKKAVTSMMRRVIPIGVSTGGCWTFNGRALRHVLTMRCEPAAEEEICYLFSKVAVLMLRDEPHIFGDFYQDEDGFWRPRWRKV